jgi:uncharacterized membrane protein YphA (DoxX/SURF4 family)
MKTNYIKDYIETVVGNIPQVATKLSYKDHLGTLKVRWLIGRDNYKVEPGLYAVGNPTNSSDVFVTANYKLSFDHLRKNLDGLNAWILVLDTKGINVWCAAGKGTFGTKELINRIKLTKLDLIVTHRKLIVPQLGATGVSAYQVKEGTSNFQSGPAITSPSVHPNINSLNLEPSKINLNRGFNVVFGPVRASDIKSFIQNGYKSTNEMRKVTFNFIDRVKLTTVDLVYARYKLLAAFALVFILSGLNKSGISFNQAYDKGFSAILNIFLAYVTGIIITPILLPYLPFKKFAFKGLATGLILSFILIYFKKLGENYFEISSWILIISGISSFMAMNFTGASTFTSLSGVKKEMKIAVPIQILFAVVGMILLVIGKLF